MNQTFSYWEQESFFNADVIIVGSGIVGLNAAIHLIQQQAHLKVIVLERGFLPSGASTKNAGFACFGSISELIEQEKILGTDGLHQVIQKRWTGLEKLRNLVGDAKLGFENNGGFELFKKSENNLTQLCVQKISHYNALIKDIIRRSNVFSHADHLISQFGFNQISTLIANQSESQLNPGEMIKGLLAIAASLDILILNHCEVNQVYQSENLVRVDTSQAQFLAKKILFTTNAFISKLYPHLDVVPGRGQVLLTSPIKQLQVKGTFHYDQGYYYFRNVDDRILIGGGRNINFKAEETLDFGITEPVKESLKNLLSAVIIPHSDFTIAYEWSGIMAFGKELKPIVKEVQTNVFFAGRCNGMGVAIGSQIGQEAAEIITQSL